MHTVLLVKLFDTKNKLLGEKVSYLYFFRVPIKYSDGIYWNYCCKNYFKINIWTINVMYTIMSTSIVFLIKVSTQTMSTMVFEPCVLSPLRPHDPTCVFHKINIKSLNRQITFCNFYVNIWSPCSSNTSIHHLFPICQISAIVIGWSTKMRLTWLVDLELLRRIQVSVSGSSCVEHLSRAVVDNW